MTKQIMVVDDNQQILEVTRITLEYMGYRVVTAISGQDVLDKLEREIPDLILLDLLMPEVDGWEVLEKMKENETYNSIPVFAFTARTKPEAIAKSKKYPQVKGYIIKPFDTEYLIKKINEIVGE